MGGSRGAVSPRRVCLVSQRLGGYDGVSVEAAKWQRAFTALGWSVTRVAGHFADSGTPGDVTLEGLWAPFYGGRPPAPEAGRIAELCATHDLLVIDNAGSLPTCPETALALEAEALRRGIPTIVRHHDPPWQSLISSPTADPRFPLHDPRMLHVTINRLTEAEYRCRYPELAHAGAVTTIYNTVDFAALAGGRRSATRMRRGISDHSVLLVHPARNIARKNVPAALRVAGEVHRRTGLDVHYWLTDPSGHIGSPPEGVFPHRGHARSAADLYAAADVVLLPSHWEGWGLPVIEAAATGRPVVTHCYPVLREIHDLGIGTVDHCDVERITALLGDPVGSRVLTETNRRHARALDTGGLPGVLFRAGERAARLMAAGGRRSGPRSAAG